MLPAVGAALIAGAGGLIGQLVGGQQNKRAQERQWEQDEYMLQEGPSMYQAGMEKAGLNPLLMSSGGGIPPSALNPSQSTPKVTDPSHAAATGISLAKAISEIQRTRAETDLITSKTTGQETANTIAEAGQKAAAKGWIVNIGGKETNLNKYDAEAWKTINQAWQAQSKGVKDDILRTYIKDAYNWVKDNGGRDAGPEVMKMRAIAIALSMLKKEEKWQTTKMVGGLLSGATGGMGAAAIKGMLAK